MTLKQRRPVNLQALLQNSLPAVSISPTATMLADELCMFFEMNNSFRPTCNLEGETIELSFFSSTLPIDVRPSEDTFYRCYFRLKKDSRFVIASGGYSQKRRGHGSRLMKFLCDTLPKYNFNTIEIECPNKESTNFGLACGMHEKADGNLAGLIETIDAILTQRGVSYQPVRQE